eukprot:GHVN01056877.1.p1 GENE.GHVN01056877.1~~GHVN01056877.1.p1  ORF type:complete len:816 (-),score=128.21 GHVN01056877.1:1576-4023(-)
MIAVLTHAGDIVKSLLDRGAGRDITDNTGRTALVHAVQSVDGRLVTLLLNHEADQTILTYEGLNALSYALGKGAEGLCRRLLDDPNLMVNYRRAREENRLPRDSQSTVAQALIARFPEDLVLQILRIQTQFDRADICQYADENGRSTLWWAVEREYPKLVSALLDSLEEAVEKKLPGHLSCNPHRIDREMVTPLQLILRPANHLRHNHSLVRRMYKATTPEGHNAVAAMVDLAIKDPATPISLIFEEILNQRPPEITAADVGVHHHIEGSQSDALRMAVKAAASKSTTGISNSVLEMLVEVLAECTDVEDAYGRCYDCWRSLQRNLRQAAGGVDHAKGNDGKIVNDADDFFTPHRLELIEPHNATVEIIARKRVETLAEVLVGMTYLTPEDEALAKVLLERMPSSWSNFGYLAPLELAVAGVLDTRSTMKSSSLIKHMLGPTNGEMYTPGHIHRALAVLRHSKNYDEKEMRESLLNTQDGALYWYGQRKEELFSILFTGFKQLSIEHATYTRMLILWMFGITLFCIWVFVIINVVINPPTCLKKEDVFDHPLERNVSSRLPQPQHAATYPLTPPSPSPQWSQSPYPHHNLTYTSQRQPPPRIIPPRPYRENSIRDSELGKLVVNTMGVMDVCCLYIEPNSDSFIAAVKYGFRTACMIPSLSSLKEILNQHQHLDFVTSRASYSESNTSNSDDEGDRKDSAHYTVPIEQRFFLWGAGLRFLLLVYVVVCAIFQPDLIPRCSSIEMRLALLFIWALSVITHTVLSYSTGPASAHLFQLIVLKTTLLDQAVFNHYQGIQTQLELRHRQTLQLRSFSHR